MTGSRARYAASADNASIRRARSLLSARTVRETGLFLLEGPRFVSDILRRDPGAIVEVIVDEDALSTSEFTEGSPVPMLVASPRVFSTVSTTEHSQGVIAVCRRPDPDPSGFRPAQGPGAVMILDGLQDPGNAGTLTRTAAGLGCLAVFTVHSTCEMFSAKATRAAAGTSLLIPLFQRVRPDALMKVLVQGGFELMGADAGGTSYQEEEVPSRVALVLGSEAAGLSPEMLEACRLRVSIPLSNGVESFNAASAGAILLSWIRRGQTKLC